MCKLVLEIRLPESKIGLGKNSLPNSLGLSAQPCMSAMAARRCCEPGLWGWQIGSTPDVLKDWIGQVRERADALLMLGSPADNRDAQELGDRIDAL